MQDPQAVPTAPSFIAPGKTHSHFSARVAAAVFAGALLFAAGCNKQAAQQPAPRSDDQVASDIQAKINGESALNGQNIQVAVNSGVATLSGVAGDDASRALAGNDAGGVSGVKTVVNNLTVAPKQEAAVTPPPAPAEQRPEPTPRKPRHHQEAIPAPAAAPESSAQTPQPEMAAVTPPPAPAAPAPAPEPVAPPPPPKPVAKTVILPEGTVIPVRMIDTLDSQNTPPNQSFRATLAGDLIADGMVALPQGTTVIGRVVDAKDAAHFKGSALLSIELTAVDSRGRNIPLVTDTYTKEGNGRGKNTAEKAGGGAALGAIIGALAGGGKGAAIGAVTGGGVGAGVNAVTRGQQVQIASESLVNFHLQSPVTVTTSRAIGAPRQAEDDQPQLESRPAPQK